MITNSLLIVTIILLIILVVPILCEKVHLPGIVGLIVAGVIIGPHALGWIGRNETIETLGKLGLLYLMFMSGIEISLSDLQREKYKSMLFGIFTFTIPAVLGFAASRWVFGYDLPACILLGSMLGSHTLITYPVVSRYNIQRNRAVSLIIGAVGFALVPFIHDAYLQFIPFLLIGCAWAAMLAMPFTFVTNALQGYGHMGAYLGLFNGTICIPQIIAALCGGIVLSLVGSHQSTMMIVSGVLLVAGAACVTVIRQK